MRTQLIVRPTSSIFQYQAFAVLANIFIATACGQQTDKRTRSDSEGATAAVVTAAPIIPLQDTSGSGAINWSVGDLQKRLRDVGIDLVPAGDVRQPFLGAPGMRFTMPNGEIQAYVYGDAVALSRDIDVLDTARVAPPGMMIEWRLPPALIVSNNLALILLTRDSQLRKTITEAVRPNLYRHGESARPPVATNTKKE